MPGGTIVINPLTGTRQVVTPSFSDVYVYSSGLVNYWSVKYSPDLEWVIYLDNHDDVSLWDVVAQKVIWHLEGDYSQTSPKWSPAGDKVAIIGNEGEFYRVNRTGRVKHLPELGDLLGGKVEQDAWEWSPDGQYIAFWASDYVEGGAGLLILDTQTDQVTDYCIKTDFYGEKIIWSPDKPAVCYQNG